jgi:hypothetical protein
MTLETKFGNACFIKAHGKGYYVISSSKEGNRGKQLHRLIYEDHHGPIPKGMQIHHIDGDTTNNDISNLEMVSISEHNKIHKVGNKNCVGREMSEETRQKIREKRLGTSEIDEWGGVWFLKQMKILGLTMKTVGKYIGLDDSTISRYLTNRGLRWSTLLEET